MNKYALYALLLVGGFLAGFVPQYARSARLESNMRELEDRRRRADLRDLAAQAYVQAEQKNYGLAGQTVSQFFDRVPETAATLDDAQRRQQLEQTLGRRDAITAALAKGEPGVSGQLQELYLNTRTATLP